MTIASRRTDARARACYVLAGLAVVCSSCVGPSEDSSDYARKSANSAADMISVVNGARLTAGVAGDGRAPGGYVSLRMSEAETDAHSIVTSFSSVQPPDADSDRLRTRLLAVMNSALEELAGVRMAAYRGELHRLEGFSAGLGRLSARLERFTKLGPT